MKEQFERVAIVNRGEPAMRLIHALREYNLENGTALKAIALYTEPDQTAMFVREADASWCLGPATYVDPADGARKNAYLNYEQLERALVETRAQAVWAGWGFVAEHPDFVDLCDQLGVVFIGPDAAVMRRLGDKISSKIIAEEAGVPVTPWSGGPVDTLESARSHAQRLGYPLMIKATAGGGGRGIRKVLKEEDLENAFLSARSEALKSFGNGAVFLESLVQGARHIEVQIIADHHGAVWAAGVRDCTVQRRNQKVIEEAPSPVLTPEQDREVREASVRLGKAVSYRNAGTVEFLFQPEQGAFRFMEVNARLQVEHPITELVTGLDLVKLQIHVARGGKLEGQPPEVRGHAIEARLNAEDPAAGFAPAPGLVNLFRLPTGPGLRIDTGVSEGDEIPPDFDSMIAKIIVHGATRHEALSRLKRAVTQTALVIQGGASNKGFLLALLNREEVASSHIDVSWLDRVTAKEGWASGPYAEVALVYSAIQAYLADFQLEMNRFLQAAKGGRPNVRLESGARVNLSCNGQSYTLEVFRVGTQHYRVVVDDISIEATAEELGAYEWRLVMGDQSYTVFAPKKGHPLLVEVNGVSHQISLDQGGLIRSPGPAVVISLPVEKGQTVKAGDRLAVLEAMKMETTITAPFPGKVKDIFVGNNVQVNGGAPLLSISHEEGDHQASAGDRLQFQPFAMTALGPEPRIQCRKNMDSLRCVLRGFDADPLEINRIVQDRKTLCRQLPPDDQPLLEREDLALSIFVDLIALFRGEPDGGELEDGGRFSPGLYLYDAMRNVFTGEENLPEGFLKKLRQALAHYGISEVKPGPELELCLFRICKAWQRASRHIQPIALILQRRLEQVKCLKPTVEPQFRELVNRLIVETRGRFPGIHDLAREVRYLYYFQPFLEEGRERTLQKAFADLARLEQDPTVEERDLIMKNLVDCGQPLFAHLSQKYAGTEGPMRAFVLELMIRRFYRIRNLEKICRHTREGRSLLTARYDLAGRRIHLMAAHAPENEWLQTCEQLIPLVAEVPKDEDLILDFYLRWDQPFGDRDALAERLRDQLNQMTFPHPLRRVITVLSCPTEEGPGAQQHYSFVPGQNGLEEDRLYRGLHPMMGKRLQIWRLSHFNIERLPSEEDIYLFKGQARENPRDQRLFVCAEVRDAAVVRNGKGLQMPGLERMLLESFAAIRRQQANVPVYKRRQWNRVTLYVWEPMDLRPGEIRAVVHRLASAAEGLNLDKVLVRMRLKRGDGQEPRDTVLTVSNPAGSGLAYCFREPKTDPVRPLSEYDAKVVRMQRRGLIYPYELISMLTSGASDARGSLPPGRFLEYDLDKANQLVPVHRPPGGNRTNIVAGLLYNTTPKYGEGMGRVALLGDPSRGLGSLSEPECRVIIAALDMAEEKGFPLEWYAISAGAKISMESGTENMDWIGLVLRRIIEFTQAGGEINIIVAGINVGAQPYWNAEATMLMHTKGILIMTPQSAMVLTGKRALEFSGGVSAEDNQGIGGYQRIMGPNGQGQYFARDIGEACRILFRYYDHAYRIPGERFPRPAVTQDLRNRDIRTAPHGGAFAHVGDVFSDETNPGRKKPFEIRKIMGAVIDRDHAPLERWFGMQDAEVAVVWDAHLGGYPLCLIGMESRPMQRLGYIPADGPEKWTSGTLFPQSSRKIARAINAASGNRPVAVLANLSGFDGSPESLRKWQLEYGAEIGRAVVNFKGPIVFCVVSRYHGGAFVVFSNTLNDNMEVSALEGAYASVIGGAPAAAVVFAREVDARTRKDPRIAELDAAAAEASGPEKLAINAKRDALYPNVQAGVMGEVAREFDGVHSVQRALKVGSINQIVPPNQLRSYLIDAVERGMDRELTQ